MFDVRRQAGTLYKGQVENAPSTTSLSSADKGHSIQYIAMTGSHFVDCEILKESLYKSSFSSHSKGIQLGTPRYFSCCYIKETIYKQIWTEKCTETKFKRLCVDTLTTLLVIIVKVIDIDCTNIIQIFNM